MPVKTKTADPVLAVAAVIRERVGDNDATSARRANLDPELLGLIDALATLLVFYDNPQDIRAACRILRGMPNTWMLISVARSDINAAYE